MMSAHSATRLLRALACLFLVASWSCSQGSSNGGSATTDCKVASAGFLSSIESGFKKSWKDTTLHGAQYISTGEEWSNGRTIFMVAARVEDSTAVFGTDVDPAGSGSGLIVAANAMARRISTWATDAASDSPIVEAFADPANVTAAAECLK